MNLLDLPFAKREHNIDLNLALAPFISDDGFVLKIIVFNTN